MTYSDFLAAINIDECDITKLMVKYPDGKVALKEEAFSQYNCYSKFYQLYDLAIAKGINFYIDIELSDKSNVTRLITFHENGFNVFN